MTHIKRHFDPGSVAIIAITLALFVVALVTKGFTHELLLEAGVFLVSAKLIIISYKNSLGLESLHNKLDEIHDAVRRMESGPRD